MAEITGLILAGGKSTRMGGRVGGTGKALLPLHGKPMIEWVIERFRPQVASLLINANSAACDALGYAVIADAIAGYPGPLAGLHAGLSHAATALVVCVPCDAPLLPGDLVARLRAALSGTADVAVVRTPGGLQPAFLLCRTALASSIETFLARGGRALHDWLAQQRCVEVEFAEDAPFSNVNTPQDAERIALSLSAPPGKAASR